MQSIRWRRWNGDAGEREVAAQPWHWVGLGTAPVPQGSWSVFRYHLGHGLVMGFPIMDVLAYAWRNRDSFGPDWVARRRAEFLEDGYPET